MQQMKLIDLPSPEWIGLLKTEVGKPGNTIASVAREIGMPRPSLSLLLSGNYPAKMDRKASLYAAKVIALYADRIWCPHLHQSITPVACAGHHGSAVPMSDPAQLRHWVACKNCPQNPTRKDAADAV